MTPDKQTRLLGEWIERSSAFVVGTRITSLERLSGGQSSELFRLVCESPGKTEDRFIVRLEQRGKQLFLRPDNLREFRVMDGVARAGTVPVPPLIAQENDPAVLGMPFLIMQEIAGNSPLGRPSLHRAGMLTELDPGQRRRVAENGIDAMAAIHAIDWRDAHAFLAEDCRGRSGLECRLDRLEEWYRWAARDRAFPITDRALAWLRDNRGNLRDTEEVLLWGDARPGNILFTPDQSVAAVLDWEGALIGPRGIDVGYWAMSDQFHAEAIGVDRLPGWPDEDSVIERYRAASGKDVPDLVYYVVMGAFFMATTLIRATDIAIGEGRLSQDSTMAHANTLTQMLAERLGMEVPELSPDFVAHRNLPPGTVGLAGRKPG